MGAVTKRITLDELRQLAARARGNIDKIYLHWSAGIYHQFFSDYHPVSYTHLDVYKRQLIFRS